MSSPTRNRVDLIYHATSILFSSNLLLWCLNRSIIFTNDLVPRCHIKIQALIGNVTRICICKCIIMYTTHQFIITIRSHQAYIIILAKHLNNYIKGCSALSTVQQSSTRCSDNHTRCYEYFLSQIVKHTFQSIHYYSLVIPTHCSEIQFHCACSQFAK